MSFSLQTALGFPFAAWGTMSRLALSIIINLRAMAWSINEMPHISTDTSPHPCSLSNQYSFHSGSLDAGSLHIGIRPQRPVS